MQNNPWQNFAFISYRHTDMRWARWLQRKLESYRLPATLQKKTEAPARIRPVFRDNTDLSSGLLREELRKELARSRFLIVVCSRELAHKSEYVDFEIQCFLDSGREKDIIPFIIDGVPFAPDPADECFPTALRGMADPPLGIDLQKDARRKAFIRLVSALLGVRFDTLWQRDVRRTRVKRAVAAVAAAIALAGGALAYDYYVPKSRHYADYALRYGVPEGIGELSAEQVRQSGGFYTLISSRGQVRELRHENAYGALLEDDTAITADRPVWVKFETYSGDALRVARYYNQSGAPILTLKYSELFGTDGRTQTIDFYQGYNDSIAQNMVADLAGATTNLYRDLATGAQRSRIIRNIVTYTAEGFACRVLYASDTRSLKHYAADANGIYGQDYEVNSLGQRTRIYNLNARGERATLPNGVYSERIEYDGFLPVRDTFLNEADAPIRGENGYAWQTYEYDGAYNVTAYTNLDAQGKPTLCTSGYARAEFTYRNGDKREQRVLNASLAPCYTFGYSACINTYEQGWLVSTRCLDAEGNPCRDEDGYAEIRFTYDDQNRLAREECRDENGNLCFNRQGYAIALYTFDAQSNQTRTAYLDPEGNPCYTNDGICVVTWDYQDSVLCAIRYLDGDNRPVINPQTGFATMLVEYEDDNRTRETYLDAEGNPCCCKDGYAEARYTYEDGNQTGIAYFGTDGLPCYYQNISVWQMTYQDGHLASTKYYDVTGQLKNCNDGYAEYRNTYDDLGYLIGQTYYDVAGNLCKGSDGYACVRYTYDEQGRKIKEAYFDKNRQAIVSNDGYHAVTYTYDGGGRRQSVSYLNTDQNYRCVNGRSTEKLTYDERGNLTERSLYLWSEGRDRPTNCFAGWSVERMAYNRQNQMISDAYLDSDGKPCTDLSGKHQYLYRYNERGELTGMSYLGTDGKPLPMASAYAAQYNTQGLLTCEQLFRDGDILDFQTIYAYNQRGQRTEVSYWQGETTPLLQNGYHRVRYTYNDFGAVEKTEYFGTDEQPVTITGGYAVIITQRDAYGRQNKEEYRDGKGALCENTDGYAQVECDYDERGLIAGYHYFGTDGKPRSPLAAERYTYDALGNQTEIDYLGPDGQPVIHPDKGFATERMEWQGDRLVSDAYYDMQRQPLSIDGVARYGYTYDASGINTSTIRYAADGSVIRVDRWECRCVKVNLLYKDMPGLAAGLQVGDVLLSLGDWQYDATDDTSAPIDRLEAYIPQIQGTTIPAVFLQTLADGSEKLLRIPFSYGEMGIGICDEIITKDTYEHLISVARSINNTVP